MRSVRVKENKATSHLVFAKTRVAPVTKATIPKLELSAAHLMSKLLSEVRNAHDSMITLHWIVKSPAKLETFQANRVAEIQELTEGARWSHIATKDNPANLASRGVQPSKLVNNPLWWNGPEWLTKPMSQWPSSKLIISQDELRIAESATRKERPIVAVASANTCISNDEGPLIEQYSSWTNLMRVTALVLGFINNLRNHTNRRGGEIRAVPSPSPQMKAIKFRTSEIYCITLFTGNWTPMVLRQTTHF